MLYLQHNFQVHRIIGIESRDYLSFIDVIATNAKKETNKYRLKNVIDFSIICINVHTCFNKLYT